MVKTKKDSIELKWAIRIQASKVEHFCVFDHEEGSETIIECPQG